MPHDAAPSPFSFDLKPWPTHEEEESIRVLLKAVYGDRYDPAEAGALLSLADKCFEQADAMQEWPDIELWRLLCEAQERVEWLQQLFAGQTPSGWKLPPAVVCPDHIRNADRRKALGLDDPDWLPSAYNPRLASSLAEASEQGELGAEPLSGVCDSLSVMQAVLIAATEETEPERRPMNDQEIKSASQDRRDRTNALAEVRRKRPITVAGEVEARVDDLGLEFFGRPFLQGRRPAPAPLVTLVEALAVSWHRVFDTLPPLVRPPSTTTASEKFASILRLFEASYRRQNDELGRAVVDAAINRMRARGSPDQPSK